MTIDAMLTTVDAYNTLSTAALAEEALAGFWIGNSYLQVSLVDVDVIKAEVQLNFQSYQDNFLDEKVLSEDAWFLYKNDLIFTEDALDSLLNNDNSVMMEDDFAYWEHNIASQNPDKMTESIGMVLVDHAMTNVLADDEFALAIINPYPLWGGLI
ncbi:MAG: hypothetical protein BWK73_23505 [Thiothrix lacustris]|uniref:Uncharacterized protein n=1 Tax=Thiothrix lacustris TaxID=525917 RepID=A0A1Y1QMA1_9GAMM|nr:MAG: hypothetical protein BWK73_23505 [Thiothrix lacustris]